MKVGCICLPRCLGGGISKVEDKDNDIMKDNRPHIHRKLSQYFSEQVPPTHARTDMCQSLS